MGYETIHKYVKEMVRNGDLGIVISNNQILLQVKDLDYDEKDKDKGMSVTHGFEGVYNREVTDNEEVSENNPLKL